MGTRAGFRFPIALSIAHMVSCGKLVHTFAGGDFRSAGSSCFILGCASDGALVGRLLRAREWTRPRQYQPETPPKNTRRALACNPIRPESPHSPAQQAFSFFALSPFMLTKSMREQHHSTLSKQVKPCMLWRVCLRVLRAALYSPSQTTHRPAPNTH